MTEYINKTELIKNIKHKYSIGLGCESTIMRCIQNMPQETNLKPIELSEWIWDENAEAWTCKECGVINNNIPQEENAVPYVWSGSKFCPECGRSMVS